MGKSKNTDPAETDPQSSPIPKGLTDEPIVNSQNVTENQDDAAVTSGTQAVTDPATQPADESLNISTPNTSMAEDQPQQNLKKSSSNFSLIERTFILMAIAAVRADPKWRNYEDPAHPDAIKDFCEPFCHAVREKLIFDPDFRGRVTVLTDGGRYRRPSRMSIWKIWTNLYLNGSLTRPQHNLGRKKDIAAEERVKQYLKNNPDCKMSSRAIAAQTQTSHRNVIRIIQQENLAIRKTKFKRIDESAKKRPPRKSPKKTTNED